jgi:YesN/AraC family two-component response regulator
MNLNKYKLLIVEDSEEILNDLTLFFSTMFKVFTASNITVATNLTNKIIPDLILLDLNFEEKNEGLDFLKKIKLNLTTLNIPVIIISGVSNDDIIVKALELGANDYLIKPFRLQQALLKASNLLALIHSTKKADQIEIHQTFIESNIQYKEVIKNLNEFLRNNYQNSELKISDIESYLGVNRHVLNNITKAKFGKTPIQYLKIYRLLKARRLMRKDNIPKNLVFNSVGFESQNYFSNCFKKEFGLTPLSFIKKGLV